MHQGQGPASQGVQRLGMEAEKCRQARKLVGWEQRHLEKEAAQAGRGLPGTHHFLNDRLWLGSLQLLLHLLLH